MQADRGLRLVGRADQVRVRLDGPWTLIAAAWPWRDPALLP
ncbi:hypothetical protein ABC766_09205 [Methylobacterium fujisawaense]